MNPVDYPECALCGTTGPGIAKALVHWLEALPGMSWEHIYACNDRPACRARVQEQGRDWPLHRTSRDEVPA